MRDSAIGVRIRSLNIHTRGARLHQCPIESRAFCIEAGGFDGSEQARAGGHKSGMIFITKSTPRGKLTREGANNERLRSDCVQDVACREWAPLWRPAIVDCAWRIEDVEIKAHRGQHVLDAATGEVV